jgi:hypothetical protein
MVVARHEHLAVVLALALLASGCEAMLGFEEYPSILPRAGTCIAGLDDDRAEGLEGMQPIECRAGGRIWRIDGVAGEGDSCPLTSDDKRVLFEERGAVAKVWIICLDRLDR